MSQQAPLFLKRVLITRQAEQAKSFTAAIQAVGGIPLTVPVLSFVPAANRTYIQEYLNSFIHISGLSLQVKMESSFSFSGLIY